MAIKGLISASAYGDISPNFGNPNSRFGIESNFTIYAAGFYHPSKANSEFQSLIDNRLNYLDSLRTLNDDWISGNSVAPNHKVIDSLKKLLVDFAGWLNTKREFTAPKLIMGPIPAGGIGLEIVAESFKIYVNIYNNDVMEMEVENFNDGSFVDIQTKDNSIEYLVKNVYKHCRQEELIVHN